MNIKPLWLFLPGVLFSATAAFGSSPANRAGKQESGVPAPQEQAEAASLSREKALQPHQKQLLDLAFRAASSVPAMPHVKARSRAQERVIVSALELGQPALTLAYLEKVDNWRRGSGYADLAFYLVENGRGQEAKPYLELARAEAEAIHQLEQDEPGEDEIVLEGFQAWRRDRIRAKIARVYHALGEAGRALEFEQGLEPSEFGIVEVARARTMSAEEIGPMVVVLGSVASEGNLEKVRNAVEASTELLRRFYADADRRALLQQGLDACLEKTPLLFRAESFLTLGELALEQGDSLRALDMAGRAGLVLESTLALEDDLPLRARIASLRHRAGKAEAKAELEQALARFDEARDSIPDLCRADILIPFAEARLTLGDLPAALETYRRAALEAGQNPNAVPRVEDLVALCCSMAKHGVAPDSELWRSLHRTAAGLRDPW
jgi:tetratricopeptide (TPR) repeat protein